MKEALYLQMLVYLIPLLLLVVGFGVGWYIEKRHYASIHQREALYADIPALNSRRVPREEAVEAAELVTGSVVVSIDRFKQFLAALRNIFGGEVHAYSSLIDRARREAMLRMKEAAPDAELFANVRLETASISKGGRKQSGTVEVLAYGTAVWYREA